MDSSSFLQQVNLDSYTLTFYLRPTIDRLFLPSYTGHLVRGVTLALIRKNDPELSQQLHQNNTIRPYSVSPVYNPNGSLKRTQHGMIELTMGDSITFQLTTVKYAVSQTLIQSLLKLTDEPIILADQPFNLEKVEYTSDHFTEKELIPNPMPSHFSIKFHTPTQFNLLASKEVLLFPQPNVIFANLMTLAIALDIFQMKVDKKIFLEYITSNVFPRAYKLRTREVSMGKALTFVGFIGWTRYKILNPSNPNSNFIPILLKLGSFLHVGNKRTAGLGRIICTSFI